MPFEITDVLIEEIQELILQQDDKAILDLLTDEHYADIAELLEDLNLDEATYIIKLLDSDLTSDILMEMDDDDREKILKNLSAKEIAQELVELDTDDAADMVAELPEERQKKVISKIEDEEHKAGIRELLKYDEDTAGGLMAKELVKVYETWTVAGCLRRIRGQAKDVRRVHSIYVVNKQEQLIGRLSLRDLITAKNEQKIEDIYISNVDAVHVDDDDEEVAKIMAKYDLEAIPVVDDHNTLLGRITIDDIVDVIKEEADKDYQMAAGLSQDVEHKDTIWELTYARLPWLFIGMMGGIGAASIINGFQNILKEYTELIIFIPLIQATAGNVGVQSSAIVVQGIANNTIKGEIFKMLFKEFLLGLVNGLALAIIIFLVSRFAFHTDIHISFIIGLALTAVIINAAIVGAFIPIFLNKRGVDPAVATGPFITTTNDVIGILIYFYIAKLILGF